MKTIIISPKNTSLIPILRFSLLTMFSIFAMIGTSQNLEINTTSGGDYMINLSSNAANNLMGGGANLTTGNGNSLFGFNAGNDLTTEQHNVFVGRYAGANATGSLNTYVGTDAGLGASATGVYAGSGNVFLGYRAGYWETGSNQLMISNSTRADALIRGDFLAEEVSINGDLYVSDILKLTATNVDPGCSTNADDLGKLWMTGVGAGRMLKVCRGSLGWQDLHD